MARIAELIGWQSGVHRSSAEGTPLARHTFWWVGISVALFAANLIGFHWLMIPSVPRIDEDHEIKNRLDDWGKHVHPDDVPQVMSESVDHIEGRTPAYEAEHRMLHRDGSTRWFVAKGVVVERVDGRAVRMIGTDTDITRRKATEQALERAQNELARATRLSEMGELAASIAHEGNQPLCAIVANAGAAQRNAI